MGVVVVGPAAAPLGVFFGVAVAGVPFPVILAFVEPCGWLAHGGLVVRLAC